MNSPRRRAGFTLVELLMVIAIIMILASATFGLYRGVANTRMKARARGEVQRIIIACESFKKTYGDYPCLRNGTPVNPIAHNDQHRVDLFEQLSGRLVLFIRQLPPPPTSTGGFAVELWPYNKVPYLQNNDKRTQKPFLSFDDIPITVVDTAEDAKPSDFSDTTKRLELRDPWGNPYEYRYRALNAVGSSVQNATGNYQYAVWLSTNFILVSCGANFAQPNREGDQPAFAEYFDSGSSQMVRTGIIPPTYFDDGDPSPRRSDNIVNWAN